MTKERLQRRLEGVSQPQPDSPQTSAYKASLFPSQNPGSSGLQSQRRSGLALNPGVRLLTAPVLSRGRWCLLIGAWAMLVSVQCLCWVGAASSVLS